MKACSLILKDLKATEQCASALAQKIKTPMRIYLKGEIGTGKTSFARALLRALGVEGSIQSPTFTLMVSYAVGSLIIYHFDLYRLETGTDLEALNFREYFEDLALILVEWPEQAQGILPPPDLLLEFTPFHTGIKIVAHGNVSFLNDSVDRSSP